MFVSFPPFDTILVHVFVYQSHLLAVPFFLFFMFDPPHELPSKQPTNMDTVGKGIMPFRAFASVVYHPPTGFVNLGMGGSKVSGTIELLGV